MFVVRIEIDYKKPASTDDELIIQTNPLKKGTVSGVMLQQIWRGAELLTEARVTWAFVDSKGVPVKLPPRWDLLGLKP